MVSIGFLVLMLLLLPFAIRTATKKRDSRRGLRWRGIDWERPDETDERVMRAVSKQKAGDLAGAIAEYDRALALKRTAMVLNNRGCALLEAGHADRALSDLREAVALAPESATAHCSLAEALARTGDSAAALASLKRAAVLDPAWRTYARTADAFSRLRDSEDGRRWLAGD